MEHKYRLRRPIINIADTGNGCYFCPSGGIGEAVCSAVSDEAGIRVRKLAVPRIPRSGPPAVLLDMFGISAKCIVAAVESFN